MVSAGGPGRHAERGALGLGASGERRAPSGGAGVVPGRGLWGPGLGGPACGPRVRAAAPGPSAGRGEDSVRMAGFLSRREPAVLGSGPTPVANLCDLYSLCTIGLQLSRLQNGRMVSD